MRLHLEYRLLFQREMCRLEASGTGEIFNGP